MSKLSKLSFEARFVICVALFVVFCFGFEFRWERVEIGDGLGKQMVISKGLRGPWQPEIDEEKVRLATGAPEIQIDVWSQYGMHHGHSQDFDQKLLRDGQFQMPLQSN